MADSLYFNILEIGFLNRKAMNLSTKNKICYVLSCRLNGSAVFHTEKGDLNVTQGDVVYIPKGKSYSQSTKGEEVIFIHLEIFGNVLKSIEFKTPNRTEYVIKLFKDAYYHWQKKDNNYLLRCISLIYEILAETSCGIKNNYNEDLLSPAVKYINENYSSPEFSLTRACQESHISRAYFNRTFKEKFNTTPTVYINKLKIEKAKMMLLSGGYTHAEVAEICGFNDVKYFYTVFKRMSGTSARRFQKSK